MKGRHRKVSTCLKLAFYSKLKKLVASHRPIRTYIVRSPSGDISLSTVRKLFRKYLVGKWRVKRIGNALEIVLFGGKILLSILI